MSIFERLFGKQEQDDSINRSQGEYPRERLVDLEMTRYVYNNGFLDRAIFVTVEPGQDPNAALVRINFNAFVKGDLNYFLALADNATRLRENLEAAGNKPEIVKNKVMDNLEKQVRLSNAWGRRK